MYQTKKNLKHRKEDFSINKELLINYLYFLLDKIDPAYINEVSRSINKMISKIENGDYYE